MFYDSAKEILLTLGSISGLLLLPYTIVSNQKTRGRISLAFHRQSESDLVGSNPVFYWTGCINNQSSEANTITSIECLSVHKDTLAKGYCTVAELKGENTEESPFPLSIPAKQAVFGKFAFVFESKEVTEVDTEKTFFILHDVNGLTFTAGGSLISPTLFEEKVARQFSLSQKLSLSYYIRSLSFSFVRFWKWLGF